MDGTVENAKLTDAQRDFLTRYLGLRPGAGDTAAATDPLLSLWTDAKDEADRELDTLAGALRSSGLPLFERIADAGLHAITNGQFVALQTALMDYDRTPAAARGDAAAQARKAVEAMRGFLTSEPAVGLLEKNPFGVAVGLRGRLGAALDRIDARLGG